MELKIKPEYKIGNRTLKTVIAVFICLVVNFMFQRKQPFFAVTAAILCIQPTYVKSKDIGYQRILGTVIGSIFSFIVLEIARHLPFYNEYLYLFLVPLSTLILISICNAFRLNDSITVGLVTFSVIVLTRTGDSYIIDTLPYVLERTFDTILGVIVGLAVNKYFFKGKWQNEKYSDDTSEELIKTDKK